MASCSLPVRPFEPHPALVRKECSAAGICRLVRATCRLCCTLLHAAAGRAAGWAAGAVSCLLTALSPKRSPRRRRQNKNIESKQTRRRREHEQTINQFLIAIASFRRRLFHSVFISSSVSFIPVCSSIATSQLWMPTQRSRRTDTLSFFFYLLFYFNGAPK